MRHAGILGLALLVLCTAGLGCTKRVPWEEPIDSRKVLVLTFADSTQVRGKINLDERVELTKDGAIFRGYIEDLTEEEIELRDCRFVRRAGGIRASQDRMESARVDLGVENIQSLVLDRADIVRTQQVQIDARKSASRSVFWVVAGTVTAFLLSEKS